MNNKATATTAVPANAVQIAGRPSTHKFFSYSTVIYLSGIQLDNSTRGINL